MIRLGFALGVMATFAVIFAFIAGGVNWAGRGNDGMARRRAK